MYLKKYLKDASILSIGILVSRIMGLIFVFPFSRMIGEEGLSLYTYAYVPYSLFLDLSTLGIPIGISKLIAKYNANNENEKGKVLFKNAIMILSIIGVIFFILLNVFAHSYAKMILGNQTKIVNELYMVEIVIRIISLSLIIIPVVSVYRGYLQGNLIYKATAISQIVEQFLKISFSLILVYYITKVNNLSYEFGVYGAIFSTFIGSVGAFLVVYICYKKKKELVLKKEKWKMSFPVVKEILLISIPFGIFGISFGLFQMVDSLFFNRALINLGFENTEQIYGIMTFNCQKLVFIPISLLLCIAPSILPRISKEKANNRYEKINFYIEDSIQKTILISLPIVCLTYLFSREIYAIFFKENIYGDQILKVYSFIIVLFVLNGIIINVLLGLNQYKKACFTLIISLITKLSTTYWFLMLFGYVGSILSSILAFSVAVIIGGLFVLKEKFVKKKSIILKNSFLIIINVIISLVVFLVFYKINMSNIYLKVILNTIIYLTSYFILIKMSHLFKNKIN